MDRSEGNDDELYPPAPVPAHERPWRHPSEIGQQAWLASEPPLTIGRGLTAVTGTIGGVLALAVLWTMIPTHAGRSAAPGVVSSVANSSTFAPVTTSAASAPTTTRAPATTTGTTPPTTSATTDTAVTAPVSTAPLPTYMVAAAPAQVEQAAVAVAVNSGSLVITTANAVTEGNTVQLVDADGGTEVAEVLLVDQRNGFAVLAHEGSGGADESFTVATSVTPGESLTVYGTDQVTAVVQADGSIEAVPADPAVPPELREGTPVVNDRGELVALCSHSDEGPEFVTLGNLDHLRKALATGSASKVWLGVRLKDDASGALVVESVDAASPASLAGIVAGDVIDAIDGITVLDLSAVGAALGTHQPGDTVPVVVMRDGAERTLQVLLGIPPASI